MKKSVLMIVIALFLVVGTIYLVKFTPVGGDNTTEPPKHNVENPITGGEVLAGNEQPVDVEVDNPAEVVDEITLLVDGMSLEEKIGQLIIGGFQGVRISDDAKELIHSKKIGGFILFAHNLESPEQSLKLLNDLKLENKENDFPLFLSVDQEGGRVTRLPGLSSLPTNEQIAMRDDLEYAYRYGEMLGDQLNAFGFQLNFAPSIDVNSNPDNPVIGNRSFGSDPNLVSDYGKKVLQGMADKNVIGTIKHFPGHGDTHLDSHVSMPVVDKRLDELRELELIPFKRAIDSGVVDAVMTAHILLPKLGADLPATMSKKVITDLLRDELGYDGVVITDDMTMGAITTQYGVAEAAVKAVNAGVDIVLVAHGQDQIVATFDRLMDGVASGEISLERVDESVARVLRLKEKYNLVDEVIDSIDVDALRDQIAEVVK